jgi:hypothetical protein
MPGDTAADKVIKVVMDCRRKVDSGICSLIIRKVWTDSGRIVIRTLNEMGYSPVI